MNVRPCIDAQRYEAPTGRKGIAQGKAKRRPGFRDVINIASPEREEPAVRKSCDDVSPFQGFGELGRRTTQGGAALYPGLSHYAPLGRTIRLRNGVDCALQAIQVVLGYSGWRLLRVLCLNGVAGSIVH